MYWEALIRSIPSCPSQSQAPLVFNEFIEQLFAFGDTGGLQQQGLESGNIIFQRQSLLGFRSRECLFIFEGRNQSSPTDAFQNPEGTRQVPVLIQEFEMLQIGLT